MADTGFIMTQPPLWVGAQAVYPYSADLVKKFTLTDRFNEVHRLWDGAQNGELIKIPRGFCPAPTPETDKRAWQARNPLATTITPRDDQQTMAMAKVPKLILEGRSFCINAQTGSGKTVVGIKALGDVGVQTLIIVPKDDLFTQWQTELAKFGIPKHLIGSVRGDKFDVAGKQVVVGMLHSVAKPDRYPSWFYGWPGLMIIDEVHRIAAVTFLEAMKLFNARVRVGLSATHTRADGMDVAIRGHIGPVLVNMDIEQMIPKVLVHRTNWMVPRWRQRDPITGQAKMVKAPHSPGKSTHIVTRMIHDQARNLQIAEGIAAAYEKGRKIVAFSDIIEHLEIMQGMLRGQGVLASDIALYIGGLKKEEREIVSRKRVILATWGSMAEGTDIPALDTAVFMTPRSNVTQAAGRIRRVFVDAEGNPKKKFPAILDYVDEDSFVFKAYGAKRRAWYASIGCEIVDIT